MKKYCKFFLAYSLVLTLVTLAKPPDAVAQMGGTVEGIVTLNGNPVIDAEIQFKDIERRGKPLKVKTTKKGCFNRFIPIGRYKVAVHINNEKVWENPSVEVCAPRSGCLEGKDTRVIPPISLVTAKGVLKVNNENWICQKCSHKEYEVGEIHVAGGFWPKIFNIQNKKYASISCLKCSYTEFYKGQKASTVQNIFDFFTN